MPATQSVDREILIGIGHSLDRPNLWSGAEQSRIVGITTFFLGDGSYMLGERLRSVAYADYFNELLKSLEASIIRDGRVCKPVIGSRMLQSKVVVPAIIQVLPRTFPS